MPQREEKATSAFVRREKKRKRQSTMLGERATLDFGLARHSRKKGHHTSEPGMDGQEKARAPDSEYDTVYASRTTMGSISTTIYTSK